MRACFKPYILAFFISTQQSWASDILSTGNPCISTDYDPIGQTTSDIFTYTSPATIKSSAGHDFRLLGLISENLVSGTLESKRNNQIKRFLSAETVTLYTNTNQKPDRYGRRPAFLSRQGPTDQELLQEKLISAGLARVSLEGLDNRCGSHLLALEDRARQANRGLWKLPAYSVRNADKLQLSTTRSTYQIISGRVRSVSRNINGTSYLNFGDNWYRDFTISFGKAALRDWEAENKILDDLQNKPIYVRGWVEDRGGPLIRISNALQLRVRENSQSSAHK